MISKKMFAFWIVFTLCAALAVGVVGTRIYNRYEAASNADHNYLSLQEYAQWKDFKRLYEVENIINNSYYQPVDKDTLITGAIKGMVDSLGDPYSVYYTPEEYSELMESMVGTYSGIGVTVQLNEETGYVKVVTIFKGSPAEKAGVKSGDEIFAVDGTEVGGLSLESVVAKIRGESGTTVKITFLRDGEKIDLTVARESISLQYVEYEMLPSSIAYIIVSEFSGNVVEEFEAALKDAKEDGAKGYIIDLRANPGGSLTAVCDMADMFLPKGTIVYTVDNRGNREDIYSDEEEITVPTVVLVDGNSASASEIFAGSLQDYGKASLVGKTTFGKGIVQSIMGFSPDNAGIKLTTSTYYTPKGRSIHGVGLIPDYDVDLPEAVMKGEEPLTHENDTQLQKAIEVLQGQIDEE